MTGHDWKRVWLYGALLGAGTLALAAIDWQRRIHAHAGNVALFAIAAAFLALGIWVGARVFGAPPRPSFDGNPAAQASLGISARELAVLAELAAGRSNKEIAARLHVSPNTVKTHIARLFDKLGAKRRTDAIARARELGLVR